MVQALLCGSLASIGKSLDVTGHELTALEHTHTALSGAGLNWGHGVGAGGCHAGPAYCTMQHCAYITPVR